MEKGILDIGLGEYVEHKIELARLLLADTQLSHRKIAKLLEIDNDKVHSISRGINKD